jgi:hypothetical protein
VLSEIPPILAGITNWRFATLSAAQTLLARDDFSRYRP